MKTLKLAKTIRDFLLQENKTKDTGGATGFILSDGKPSVGGLDLINEELSQYAFYTFGFNEQGEITQKLKITVENLLSENQMTLDDKISFQTNHLSHKRVREKHLISESGEKFLDSDVQLLVYLKCDKSIYWNIYIKQTDIGKLYELVEDDYYDARGKIVVRKK